QVRRHLRPRRVLIRSARARAARRPFYTGIRIIRTAKVYASWPSPEDQAAAATGPRMCPNADPRKRQETAKRAERRFRQILSNTSETSRLSFRSIGFREDLLGRDAGIRTRRLVGLL